ncbi:hypothetical protein EON63_06595 [archaeon]|nr:MAG: hypothetical protein EON63_06595 [archaeon]
MLFTYIIPMVSLIYRPAMRTQYAINHTSPYIIKHTTPYTIRNCCHTHTPYLRVEGDHHLPLPLDLATGGQQSIDLGSY